MISLIVFTDKYQGHVRTFYTKWFFITFKLYPNTLHHTFMSQFHYVKLIKVFVVALIKQNLDL